MALRRFRRRRVGSRRYGRRSLRRRIYLKRTRPSKFLRRYKKKYTGYTRPVKRKLYMSYTLQVASGATSYSSVYTFALNMFNNYTQYTAMYKEFKICALKMRFHAQPLYYGQSVDGAVYGEWIDSLNLDGAPFPTTRDTALQQGTARRITTTGQSVIPARSPGDITRYWRPNVSASYYSSGVTAYGGMKKSGGVWLSTNDAADVVHYGLNVYFRQYDISGAADPMGGCFINYDVTAYCKFRGAKE